MSLAVFPFKDESDELIIRNLGIAARAPRIDEVWAIGRPESDRTPALESQLRELTVATGVPIRFHPEQRLGTYRPGKGDGMNTGILLAAESGRDRVHFYDADITNLSGEWIEGAEAAADRGFGVVRHRFPRAATDAMITWMITRPGLAAIFGGTMLPRLDQPLGGELLVQRAAVEHLAASKFVQERSDWGIDTLIAHATATGGFGVYEHHVADGKRHALYGSLAELRSMALECLDAVSSLRGRDSPGPDDRHASDKGQAVPDDLKTTVAYDTKLSKALLTGPLPPLGGLLPPGAQNVLTSWSDGTEASLDHDLWYETLHVLLSHFVLGDPDWEEVAFRLWVARVITYTEDHAALGYDHAMDYLRQTIRDYEAPTSHS